MTNPNNAVGTNGAYNGRTSVNAFNDNLALYSGAGVVSGWALSPDSGMNIYIGGAADTRDVAVAEDVAGNRTTINNISGSPISVTIPAAPAAGSRIDLVVAYVVNPPQGSETEVDNPAACGLIVVSGTASSTPVAPNDSAIRSAITADGAAGSTAYYAILGQATVPNGTTDIDATMLSDGVKVSILEDIVPAPVENKELWSGSSNSSIVLSETSANFNFIEIYYSYGSNGELFYNKIANPNGAKPGLMAAGFTNANTMNYEFCQCTISGTSITKGTGMRWNNTWGTTGISATQTNADIYFRRIIGIY